MLFKNHADPPWQKKSGLAAAAYWFKIAGGKLFHTCDQV